MKQTASKVKNMAEEKEDPVKRLIQYYKAKRLEHLAELRKIDEALKVISKTHDIAIEVE